MSNQVNRIRVAKATYNFAVDGGLVSTITPVTSEIVPLGAIVKAVYTDALTATTSGGSATVAINAGGTTLVAAGTLAANSLSGTLKVSQTLSGSATAIKTAANGFITVTVAVAALTAGKFDVYVEYMI